MGRSNIIEKKDIADIFALTPLQEGILFHYIKSPGSDLYFEQLCLGISGKIDVRSFKEAWNFVIKNNEMLRATFRWEKIEKPVQIILKEHELRFQFHDLPAGNTVEENRLEKDRLKKFDLREVPFRVTLYRLAQSGEERYEMIISNHHIIYDGWSNGIILNEFFAAYDALMKGEKSVKSGKNKFKEFVKWIKNQDETRQEKYWREYLADFDTPTKLPLKQHGSKETIAGANVKTRLGYDFKRKIESFVHEHKITSASLFYSVFGLLLQKYTDSNDVIFGTTVSGRSAAIKNIENIVGLFINTLPLRVQTESHEKIINVSTRINNALQMREEYETTPLVDIKKYSRLDNREEMFDSIVVIENYPINIKSIMGNGSLSIDSYSIFEMTNYDLTVAVSFSDDIEINIIYNSEFLEHETIERLSHHLCNILKEMIENPTGEAIDVEILSPEEKQQLLFGFNGREADYPCDRTIPQSFTVQAAKTPDNIALFGLQSGFRYLKPRYGVSLTYRMLDCESGRTANYLLGKGAQKNTLIGILADRSLELIVGILGILKAGCGYVPLNPKAPLERTKYILEECSIDLLLTTRNLEIEAEQLKSTKVETILIEECRDELLDSSAIDAVDPVFNAPQPAAGAAYVIYTSGSTGKPKGVPITHANFCPLMYWGYNAMGIRSQDRVLQNLSFYFDWSVWEIFIALTSGAGLIMISDELIIDPAAQLRFMETQAITVLHITPTHFQTLVDVASSRSGQALVNLKCLAIGAEKLSCDLVKRAFELVSADCRVFNMYGPTEATIMSAVLEIERRKENSYKKLPSIPIGFPISNLELLVLDRNLRSMPIHIPGELYIGGDGVASGYLNNPELTTERFVIGDSSFAISHSKFSLNDRCPMTNDRLYRTGDLVHWLADGTIGFLGRIDQQVKIRGFRIEPGEIEKQLLAHESIKEAVVTAREDKHGELFLCAYIVAGSKQPAAWNEGAMRESSTTAKWHEYLSKTLPDYMIPSYFVTVERLPLTANGKIDIKALPEPEIGETGRQYIAPRNEIETKLVNIWRQVLTIAGTAVGIDDNFFELGGHSLRASALMGRIHKEFDVIIPLEEIFKISTIRGLAAYIEGKERSSYNGLKPAEKREYYPLSPAQKRLYILQQMEHDSLVYNMPGVMKLAGEINIEKFGYIFNKSIERHESLRTSFLTIAGDPQQRIHSPRDIEFKIEQPQSMPGNIKDFIRPFDLSEAPLLRVGLIKSKNNEYILVVDMHHIISDGTSLAIFIKDFMALYKDEELPPLAHQYRDYSEWISGKELKETIKKQETYWLKEFSGEIPTLQIPIDFPRPAIQSFTGNQIKFAIDIGNMTALRTLALEQNVTLYMLLLAFFNILLSRLSAQQDIVIGTPIAGRKHIDLAPIMGMFVNTLALRNYPDGEKSFKDFLEELKERTSAAFENQDFQFEELVEKVAASIKRDIGRNPIFDVMFIMQNVDLPRIEIPGLKSTPYTYSSQIAKFDLTLTCEEVENRIDCTLEYCTKLFKEETIERFIGYFNNIISIVLENSHTTIADIEMISPQEKKQILFDFNDTKREYPCTRMIHELFAGQAARFADNIALISRTQEALTYKQLDYHADRLAGSLTRKGLKPGDIAAVIAERTIETVIVIFAILKAGGAYLPIDPLYPAERKNYILRDSDAKFMLVPNDFNREICSDETQAPGRQPAAGTANPAYIIYTSGSTGQPKGVVVEHRSAVNILFALQEAYPLTVHDMYLLKTSFLFDVSVTELFGWFFAGGRLAILEPGGEKDPQAIIDAIAGFAVTHINFVPSMFNLFVDALDAQNIGKLAGLKYLFLAGEAIIPKAIHKFRKLNKTVILENIYGPTEGTVYSSSYSLSNWQGEGSIPIGKPMPNIQLYILDKYYRLAPTGVPGELCIAGSGLARGYLNRPELTSDKFVISHSSLVISYSKFFPNDRCPMTNDCFYRTGDLVRWLADGAIEYLGRIDQQVKIRGFRIELGEIENRLLEHEDVKEAVVIDRETEVGEKYLCAYIVSRSLNFTAQNLREYLAQTLPDYMIPAYFVFIDRIPLNANGKVDRRVLPLPEATAAKLHYVPPRNSLEERLVRIWAEVLNVNRERIGIDSNFFEIGGHSLKAILLISNIYKALNVKLKLTDIFKMQTIRKLSGYLETAGKDKFVSIKALDEKDYYTLSSAQKRIYLLQQMESENTNYNMPVVMMLAGRLEKEEFSAAFKKLIDRHESLRTYFSVINGVEVQRIKKTNEVFFKIEYYENNEWNKSAAGDLQHGICTLDSVNRIIERFIRPFDLAQAPLFRVGLFRFPHWFPGLSAAENSGEERFMLMIDMHHIISDGASMGVLIRDFTAIYRGEELPPLKIQYKDFAGWQDSRKKEEETRKQEAYWLEQFSGKLPALRLPTDFPRTAIRNTAGRTLFFEIEGETTAALKRMVIDQETTLYIILLTFYYVFLKKVSSQEDIVIGTPTAGRLHPDLEPVIGMFVNTLGLRNYPRGDMSFREFLAGVKKHTLAAFGNQDFQFEDLVEKLDINRDMSRNVLFDTMFSLQNIEIGEIKIPGLEITPYDFENKTSKFDLLFMGIEREDRLVFSVEYSTTLFKQETIDRFIVYFKDIIASVIKDIDIKLNDIYISCDLAAPESEISHEIDGDFGF